jgi:hypothetical protein
MMFYNGFNLMIDLILALIVWRVAYKAGQVRGEADLRDWYDHAEQYQYDSWREMGD